MTRKQKEREAQKQLRAMLRSALPTLDRKLAQAISSGSVPDEYFEAGTYLLAKAVLDSWCQERPYSGLNPQTKREFNNIHTCC